MPVLVELEPSTLFKKSDNVSAEAVAEAETDICPKSGCYTYSSYSATYTNATYSSPQVQYIPVYEYVPIPSSSNNNLWLILLGIIALIIISLLIVVVITK